MNKIYLSESFDPRFNLACEEVMTREVQKGSVLFFLWQNENTVVIGRNQNPYKECHLTNIEKDGVTLIRRASGGGAVYHDLGNLNFSFVAHDEDYVLEKNLQVILDAVRAYGLQANYSGRNDILLDDKKFSGNAFSRFGSGQCHHGTILVDVDMAKMADYLQVPQLKMEAKGIRSVRSRVTNLKPYAEHMTIENLKHTLMLSFEQVFGKAEEPVVVDGSFIAGKPYTDKYFTWEWSVGDSPNYSVHFEKKFEWGLTDLHVDVSEGRVKRAKIYTDALALEDFQKLEGHIIGTPYRKRDLKKSFEHILNEHIRSDFIDWVSELTISE